MQRRPSMPNRETTGRTPTSPLAHSSVISVLTTRSNVNSPTPVPSTRPRLVLSPATPVVDSSDVELYLSECTASATCIRRSDGRLRWFRRHVAAAAAASPACIRNTGRRGARAERRCPLLIVRPRRSRFCRLRRRRLNRLELGDSNRLEVEKNRSETEAEEGPEKEGRTNCRTRRGWCCARLGGEGPGWKIEA